MEREECSETCEVRSGASNVTPLLQNARAHGLGWRTAHASSIDERFYMYIYIYVCP